MRQFFRFSQALRRHWRWVAAFCLAALIAFALWLRLGPIDPALVDLDDVTSTVVVDRRGVPLYESLSGDGTRNVHLDARNLPPMLVAATLAAEDRRFWSHPGVDPVAIARALRQNLLEGTVVEGGSTITQQVAKLLLNRRSPKRTRGVREKVREAVLALRLEHRFDKREILGLYLNLAAYGNQIVGAGKASRAYFGVEPSMLTPAQSAFLAGLPQRPSGYNPFRQSQPGHRQAADGDQAHAVGRRIVARRRTRGAGGASALLAHAVRRFLRRTSWKWSSPRPERTGRRGSRRRSMPDCRATSSASSGAIGRRSIGTARQTWPSWSSTMPPASGSRGKGRATMRMPSTGARSTARVRCVSPGRRSSRSPTRSHSSQGSRRQACWPMCRRIFRPPRRASSTARATTTDVIVVRCSRGVRWQGPRTSPPSSLPPSSACPRSSDSSRARACPHSTGRRPTTASA